MSLSCLHSLYHLNLPAYPNCHNHIPPNLHHPLISLNIPQNLLKTQKKKRKIAQKSNKALAINAATELSRRRQKLEEDKRKALCVDFAIICKQAQQTSCVARQVIYEDRNKIGRRTEPWCTLISTYNSSDTCPLITTLCLQFTRKVFIQFPTCHLYHAFGALAVDVYVILGQKLS
ncbi:unnamed protein product [Meganyctiphanes norvegica]|uniref:Uncharacterized protein n=1 Tax=Meganyctiphanes norvegica TaxID=48144 RepID=A0AAV2QI43_MEGNR